MFCSAFPSDSMLSRISLLVRNRSARRRNLPCTDCKHRWKHGEALFKIKGINLFKRLNIWGSERAGGELTQERTVVLRGWLSGERAETIGEWKRLKWGNYPREQEKAPERLHLWIFFKDSFIFFESCELYPRHFRWSKLVGFSSELISSDLSKAAREGCSPTSPPAAGISRILLPGWAAITVLQKLLCALPWKGRPGMFTPLGISFMLMVWSALLVQASTFSVLHNKSTSGQRPWSCRALFTCLTKKLKTWISLGWLRKC